MGERDQATVAERIRRRLGDLTPAERKVARVLLGSYPIAGLETVTALAQRAAVSAPTVTRFVTSLDFDGYRDFQQQLRAEIHARISSPLVRYPRLLDAAGSAGLPGGFGDDLADLVTTTLRSVPPGEFDAVVDLLADVRSGVACVGGHMSRVAAHHLFDRLHQLRRGCRLIGTSDLPLEAEVLDIQAGDVLVAFDFRRYQGDVIGFAQQAAGRGARVVLVTDRWLSPVSDVAAHVFPVESETSSPFDSLVPALALVEMLVLALVGRLGESARERMSQFDDVRGSRPTGAPPGGSPATG